MRTLSRHLVLMAVAIIITVAAVQAEPKAPKTPINLNTATVAELVTLPGVGPTIAAHIVAARPYVNVEDLIRAKGIGPKKLALLKPYVVVTSKGGR